MTMNRVVSLLALSCTVQPHWEVLDAFGSTGVLGLRWCVEVLGYTSGSEQTFRGRVVINDIDCNVVELARQNAELNGVRVMDTPSFGSNDYDLIPLSVAAPLELTCENANVLMHQRCWDFIQLDPYGANSPFLDSASMNIRNNGIISMTCTDVAALYGLYPKVAQRHYFGVTSRKVFFFRELGARVVLGALARALALHHKGMKVLSVISRNHYVHIVVRVLRGLKHADEALSSIGPIYVDYDRPSYFSLSPIRSGGDGVEVQLGPCWLGSIMCPDFIGDMSARISSGSVPGDKELVRLMEKLLEEANVPGLFYYSTTYLTKELCSKVPKKSSIIQWAVDAGYGASQSHFQTEAIRSTATFEQLRAVCRDHLSAPSTAMGE